MGGTLNGKVAIITGGATKTGSAISRLFARQGAKVVVSGFCDEPVDKVVEEINAEGGNAMGYIGDISTEIKARECVTMAVNNWGKLDVLVNAAGVFPSMEEMSYYPVEAFYFMLRNNIQTAFMMTRYAIPELQKTKGSVILTGADAGLTGMARNAPYGGTKGFIVAFSKGLATEQQEFGVRVNCICSEPVDSFWLSSTRDRDARRSEGEKLRSQKTPEEIAEAYLFLAEDKNKNLNGNLVTTGKNIIKEVKKESKSVNNHTDRKSLKKETEKKSNSKSQKEK
jgi:NAD(P)-dependent dehydrogenase (short-subunit alcohol dehydrogenase family)